MLTRTVAICSLLMAMLPAFKVCAATPEPYSISYTLQGGPWFYTSVKFDHDGLTSLYNQEAYYEGYIDPRTVEKLKMLLLDKRFAAYRSDEITHTDPTVLCLRYSSGQKVIKNCFILNGPKQPELPKNVVEARQIVSSVLDSFYNKQASMRIELAVDDIVIGPKKIRVRVSMQNAGLSPVSIPLSELDVYIDSKHKRHALQAEFGNDRVVLEPGLIFTGTYSGKLDASLVYDDVSAIFSGEVISLDKHGAKQLRSRTSKKLSAEPPVRD